MERRKFVAKTQGFFHSQALEQSIQEQNVSLKLFDEAFHVFQIFSEFPEAHDARSEIGAFFGLHFASVGRIVRRARKQDRES